MKKYLVLVCVLSTIALAVGCTNPDNGTSSGSSSTSSTSSGSSSSSSSTGSTSSSSGSSMATGGSYADGSYRGAYVEGGENQVTVEFTLKDGKVDTIKYRDLMYNGADYLADNADAKTKSIAGQYQELIDAMKGKEIATEVEKLYQPEKVAKDVDGFASATLRGGKVISAIRDALNRGLYSMPE